MAFLLLDYEDDDDDDDYLFVLSGKMGQAIETADWMEDIDGKPPPGVAR